jgi:hypothetical protein
MVCFSSEYKFAKPGAVARTLQAPFLLKVNRYVLPLTDKVQFLVSEIS